MTHERPGPEGHRPDRPGDSQGRRRPVVLLFDVNETLSDMSAMAERFGEVGAPAHLATSWFAGVLRDGFSLAAVGTSEAFATIAAQSARVLLDGQPLDRDTDEAVQHVMEGFSGLPVHPDVVDGIRALAESGFRLVTLSNGSTSVAEELFDRAGIRGHFEALLSVQDAPLWKPAAAAYAYALEQCAVKPMDAMLVAVHPWDIDGATRAGLATAWINRAHSPYPDYFKAPDLSVRSLTVLATQLAAGPAGDDE